jgi:hypothetical protein
LLRLLKILIRWYTILAGQPDGTASRQAKPVNVFSLHPAVLPDMA